MHSFQFFPMFFHRPIVAFFVRRVLTSFFPGRLLYVWVKPFRCGFFFNEKNPITKCGRKLLGVNVGVPRLRCQWKLNSWQLQHLDRGLPFVWRLRCLDWKKSDAKKVDVWCIILKIHCSIYFYRWRWIMHIQFPRPRVATFPQIWIGHFFWAPQSWVLDRPRAQAQRPLVSFAAPMRLWASGPSTASCASWAPWPNNFFHGKNTDTIRIQTRADDQKIN